MTTKKLFTVLSLLFISFHLFAPPNCEIYKNDENCYQSCHEAMAAISYRQGSFHSQQYFDQSIESCPNFAYSYQQKAVPFLKRGKFIEWKKLIDMAVELAPEEYLGYRGWCRLQFLRDYEGAVSDIEQLKSMVDYDIRHCQTGDYHLNIALALCYKEIGEVDKARMLFEEHINAPNSEAGLYDYYHWGVLEYEQGNYEVTLKYLEKQVEINDYLGEAYYFMAMAYKELKEFEEYDLNLEKAEAYYRKGKMRTDTYTETMDKVYLIDIIEEKNTITSD